MSDTEVRVDSLPWVRDDLLSGDRLDIGPWVAVVTDAVPTPRFNRIAGRFIARGLLKHATGRTLSKDFGGNTRDQARLMAKRWAVGGIRMWASTLQDNALSRPGSLVRHLPTSHRESIIKTVFASLQHQAPARNQLDITESPTPIEGGDVERPRPKRKRRSRPRRRARRHD